MSSAALLHARRVRVYAWAALPLLAAVYYALLISPLPALWRLVAVEAVHCVPIVLTVVLGARAHALSEGNERVFWSSLASANFVLLLCEVLLVIWVAAIDPAGPPRVSWPFHILHGIAALFFIVAISSLSRVSQASSPTRTRWAFDYTAVALIVAVILLELYVRPVMAPQGATVAEMLLGVGYPLFGLTMALGTLAFLVGFKVDRWRTWDKLVAVSMVIYACAISLWPLWFGTATVTSRNYERGVLDLVQFSGHWLLMAAAVYRLTEVREWQLRPLPPVDTAKRRWATAIVPVLLLVSVPALALLAQNTYGDSEWFFIFVGAFTALTALTLGRSVLIALENGVLFHSSVTDPLTGLYNHRFFHSRLDEEVERARRYNEDLSVVAFDLDGFGAVNARLGHFEGERLLQEVATLMRSRCSGNCILARLGGDDFAVIVPRAGLLEASVLARRVIDLVAISAGPAPSTVTVSAGVASFPQHASDAEDLMRVVEGALYQAKLTGPEKLVVYEDERVVDLTPEERIERLEHQNRLSSIKALTAAVDARDPEAYVHARNVAALAVQVAMRIGLTGDAIRRTEAAALLHDVGMIGTSSELLAKSSEFTQREREEVRDHATRGHRILAASGLTDLLPIVRSHHEQRDGSGYPDGLEGVEIPIEARIVAACDAYDAMISDRPYRSAMSRRQARAEMAARAGTQFDPDVVEALESVLENGPVAVS